MSKYRECVTEMDKVVYISALMFGLSSLCRFKLTVPTLT